MGWTTPALGCGCLVLIALGVAVWSVGDLVGDVGSDAPPPVAPLAPPTIPPPTPPSPVPPPPVSPQPEQPAEEARADRGRVQLGQPHEERGGADFDVNRVRRALEARHTAVRRCYERELAIYPGLAGRIELRFRIEPNGSVRDARATENTLQNPVVAGCLVDTMSRVRFVPAPAEPVTISFPVVFSLESAAPPQVGAASTPSVRVGIADVRGSLSREVIRRVVQRHLSEVRLCAERGPTDEGRVLISFIIAPGGAVQSAGVGSSTIDDSAVEACIASAVRRWTFPAPQGGGVVGVNLPFVFRTE